MDDKCNPSLFHEFCQGTNENRLDAEHRLDILSNRIFPEVSPNSHYDPKVGKESQR